MPDIDMDFPDDRRERLLNILKTDMDQIVFYQLILLVSFQIKVQFVMFAG